MGDTSTRTLTARTGDVYNLADHGADGTALGANGNAGDNAALNKAIAYATLHPGTLIYLPQNINGQPWQFTASSLFTFNFPSNTTFAGAGINASHDRLERRQHRKSACWTGLHGQLHLRILSVWFILQFAV